MQVDNTLGGVAYIKTLLNESKRRALVYTHDRWH